MLHVQRHIVASAGLQRQKQNTNQPTQNPRQPKQAPRHKGTYPQDRHRDRQTQEDHWAVAFNTLKPQGPATPLQGKQQPRSVKNCGIFKQGSAQQRPSQAIAPRQYRVILYTKSHLQQPFHHKLTQTVCITLNLAGRSPTSVQMKLPTADAPGNGSDLISSTPP